jgi:hypothetical protein
MTERADPQTAAGRALLNDWMSDDILNRLPPRGLVSEQIKRIEAEAIEPILALVSEQAEDEGLWFRAETAPEAYLQQELRRLHAAIETGARHVPESTDTHVLLRQELRRLQARRFHEESERAEPAQEGEQ